MALLSNTKRRILKPLGGLIIASAAVLGFAGAAHASSLVSNITAGACVGGTVNRSVSVTYTSDAPFLTGVRVYAVTGSPTGPIFATVPAVPDVTGPITTTFTFELPAGTYYFDWEDRSGDGVTWSGRHSGLGDYYLGVVTATQTTVAECVVVEETTTTAATTTTVAQTTTTAAAAPTTATAAPTTTAAAATSTAVAVVPPTTAAAATTAVVQTTAAASANTLPATGADNAPLIGAGLAFLGLGSVAVLTTRRRRPSHQS